VTYQELALDTLEWLISVLSEPPAPSTLTDPGASIAGRVNWP